MNNCILTAETVLPVESPPIFNGSVAVSDGTIIDVGPSDSIIEKYLNFQRVDLGRGILLPGFINGHVHLELGWIQNELGEFSSFTEWLTQIIGSKAGGNVTDELIARSVSEGISDLIHTGVTTVGEISSYDGMDIDILKGSGLRAIIFDELFDRHLETLDEKKYISNGFFEVRPFPHAPYSCSPELLKKVFDMADNRGLPLATHLAESEDETNFVMNRANGIEDTIYPLIGKEKFERPEAGSPFEYISRYYNESETGLTLIHSVHVSDKEIDEMKKRNIGVILCPRSNKLLNVGDPPVAKLTELDRLGLATDGLSSNTDLDYFGEMNALLSLMEKANVENPYYRTVYSATLGGARSLFMDGTVGSISSNKKADMIFIGYSDKPEDPYRHVVSSSRENLLMNMVNGKILYSGIDHLNR